MAHWASGGVRVFWCIDHYPLAMGGYLSSKKDDKDKPELVSKGAPGEKQQKRKYRVVYTDREMKVSEFPRDMTSLFVLRRTG